MPSARAEGASALRPAANSAVSATPSGTSDGDADPKNDIANLLAVVRAHQRQHDDPQYDSTAPAAIQRCKTMLSKLKKLLPKLMRPIPSVSVDVGVPMLRDLCEIVELLLRGSMCPHSMMLFMDGSGRPTMSSLNGKQEREGSANGVPTASSYPTFATMLFYMVSFFSNENLRDAQDSVLDVILQMALFLEKNDVYGFVHFFRDTVEVLQDCFLLEESLKNREGDPSFAGASIASYLDTAIHLYQDADGPLGSKSATMLCGCEYVADETKIYERKQQLKKMLPPIHVHSYSNSIALRRSMLTLAKRLILESNAVVANDTAFNKVLQLARLFMEKDSALLKDSRGVTGETRVSKQETLEVAQATHGLLQAMFHVTTSTERKFVRLVLTFYEVGSFDPTGVDLIEPIASVLKGIRDGQHHISKFATETLWPALSDWVFRNMFRMEDSDRIPIDFSTHERHKIWSLVLEIVAIYLRRSTTSSPVSLFVDLLGCVDVTTLERPMQSAVVAYVHYILSSRSLLSQFSHFLAKSLVTNSFELNADGSVGSKSRKRTRRGSFVGSSRQPPSPAYASHGDHRSAELEVCENLGRWVWDLLFYGSENGTNEVTALSLAMRIISPFRDLITSMMRAESYSIFRVLLQRVDSVMNSFTSSTAVVTEECVDFLITMLQHFEDFDIGKYGLAFKSVLSTIESMRYFAEDDTMSEERPWNRESWKQLISMLLHHCKPRVQDFDSDVSQDSVFAVIHKMDLVSTIFQQRNLCLRAVFLVHFSWSRSKALKMTQESLWQDTTLWQIISRSILDERNPQSVACASVAMSPLLAALLSRDCESPDKVVTSLLELFVSKIQAGASDFLLCFVLEAVSSILCVTSTPYVDVEGDLINKEQMMAQTFGSPSSVSSTARRNFCQCLQHGAKTKTIAIPAHIESVVPEDLITRSETIRLKSASCLASVLRHCDLHPSNYKLLSRFSDIVTSTLTIGDSSSRQTISELFGSLTDRPMFFQMLIFPVKSDDNVNFIEKMDLLLADAEENLTVQVLLSVIPLLGAVGFACDTGSTEQVEVLIWVMLRLVSIWSKTHVKKLSLCAVSAHDQIARITAHHQVSWRRLCVEYPELCYYPLVDELMISGNIQLFLRTFMGSAVDATAFLLASARYVLPTYVVDRNDTMLQKFITEVNGTDDERSAYEDGSEGDDFRNTTIADILLNHIEYVLKEMIIHQVQVDNNENRLAEWDFLFKFLPENMTIGDIISHSPLRLLNLLSWELGGPRFELAKKAFREISQYLNRDKGNDANNSVGSGGLLMPRQYFLAIMTDLGNKISGTSSSSTASKIQAIKSIKRLFSLFKSSAVIDSESASSNGIVDPFVPKVMATLKIGLVEGELQEHAMNAWATFLRMLSVKALEANFCSIVVSLLPCIGYDPAMILQESVRVRTRHCWNVDVLQKMLPSEADTPMSSPEETKHEASKNTGSAMSTALDILKYLFIEKRNELKQAFPRIPLLPSIPELDEIYIVLEADVGDPEHKPLGDYLTDLASYVNHWDMAVREMALTQLLRCLVVRGRELQALLENEGDLFVDKAIVDIILSVLQLARTESQEIVKLLCARCLGALGAIDSARMPLSMLYESGSSQGGIVAKDRSEQRAEYSTKDLACVLIETWLVKELRAAPENTDSVAFAIQELLKFLAELTADPQHSGQSLPSTGVAIYQKPKSTDIPIMPEWMKRRFERKDVLQFVEPYWLTHYSVSSDSSKSCNGARGDGTGDIHPALDDITYYEKHGTSYEDWLLAWCRRLIDLSQPPERKIFLACRTALPTCPQIARFLLPYLMQNVLRSGKPELYGELKREVMAVLNDRDRGIMADEYMVPIEGIHPVGSTLSGKGSSSHVEEKSFGEESSRHHQCSQTIFSTIEELNEWVWSSEKKRLALSGSASRQTAGSARSVDIPSELDDQEKENLEEFLKDIPSESLSNAAYGIEAYARAIQYFEVHLRQQDYKPANGRESSSSYSMWPIHLALVSKNAFYLQQLYKSVDEPDALIGLATLRRLYEAQRHNEGDSGDPRLGDREDGLNLAELMHQVVDHEQLAQWEDALACYEQAIQEIQTALSSRAFFSTGSQISKRRSQLPRGLIADPHADPELVKPELYSGMIGCLIQLGRLESALQHINGIVTQEPEFMGTLFPYALECTWRLSRWELLADLLSSEKKNALLMSSNGGSVAGGRGGVGTRLRGIDVSQLKMIRVLHSLHNGELESFQRNLKDARLEVMGPLAAASAESYQRAYPLLHKLHFLHEAEQGFIYLQTTKEVHDNDEKTSIWKKLSPWEMRYDSMPTSLKYRDPILALRRVLLQEANLRNEVSHYWLLQAKLARKEGYARTASSAVMHAEALDNQYALLEKAKLMVSQDRMYEALQLLEPVDIDASKLDFDVEDPHFCAKNLLLATNWMQESGQRQGKKVIERYQAVIQFDPKWEKGYFFLAKYYEYLLSVSHPEATASMGEGGSILLDSVFHSHLINLMKNYVLALRHGTKFVFQSLPRLLTLWFEYGELLYTSNSGAKASKANKTLRHIEIGLSQSSTEQQILTDITQIIHDAADTLPAYEWLVCFPQVTSRICHPNPVVVDGVKKIMVKVLGAYPTQAMWPLLGLSRSINNQRRARARDIISNIQRQFVSIGQQEIANSFSEGMRLVEELISLAGHDPANQRKIHIRLSRIRSKILVPVQAALTTVLPASGLAPRDDQHSAFSPQAQIHIKAFSDKADVMMTKEKPKRIEVLGSDGRLYPFLCKREKTGDLRKDARMMEFNTMINKLLQKDGEGRKRKLRLRTYAVVCLNEESGLMEWVRNTKAMRQLIGQIHKTERGFIQPVRLTHEIKERFLTMQKKYADNVPKMAAYYRRNVLSLPVFTPRFHQWFCNNFVDPTAWFESRLTFSRSAAVWSMVGHIIGLGDRHGENILIDCTNGECVHVDFDCLFDKGLKLAKPEIVPFRLTPNMIDAFGITGYEGVFRRVCEVTMHLLRGNKETLRSVLESFIHDPLVEWGRKGKATQSAAGAPSATRSIADISNDRSKEETRIILKTIDDRLRGIYNLGDAIRPHVSSSHRSILPENETLPLSVQGQVDKLIHEATSHENLAQMYIGWMPFL
uniref:Serine/threonine-protein kinase ATR n=1 Tax=Globisporangium ultimum (strain ATCC 200006 / CBS 805.95 / DAOM BR144) TaxID=431595 RepID=K3WHU5_GLOUD